MAMATVTAHKGKPVWVAEGGAELSLTNMAAATALILNGPGRWSLDRALSLPRSLAPLGLVAVILTVLYGGPGIEAEQDEAREGAAGEDEA